MPPFKAVEEFTVRFRLDEDANFEYGQKGVMETLRVMVSQCERGTIRIEPVEAAEPVELEYRYQVEVTEDPLTALAFLNELGFPPDAVKLVPFDGKIWVFYPEEMPDDEDEV